MSPDASRWQSISVLPLVGFLIDEMLADAQERYETIQQVKGRPYVLDEALLTTVTRLGG